MPTKTAQQMTAAIESAYDHVHPNAERLVKECAAEFSVSNMGQRVEDFIEWLPLNDPSTLFACAFENFYQQSDTDDMAMATMDEFRFWRKKLHSVVKAVKDAGKPLTVRSVRDAWTKKDGGAK